MVDKSIPGAHHLHRRMRMWYLCSNPLHKLSGSTIISAVHDRGGHLCRKQLHRLCEGIRPHGAPPEHRIPGHRYASPGHCSTKLVVDGSGP